MPPEPDDKELSDNASPKFQSTSTADSATPHQNKPKEPVKSSTLLEPEPPASTSPGDNSYAQILRSSSIIGGATGINYVIGLVRTKTVALLLGPSGVGLVGLYINITGLVSTITQLGIDQSGVREVAEANSSGDPVRVARVVKTLRRVSWITGIFGWLLTLALAAPLTKWIFGSPERMWTVAILGVSALIGSLTGSQTALLQGMRRIGDLARIQVLSGILATLSAVGLYAWRGERAIVFVIIATGLIHLGISWNYSRRIRLTQVTQSWADSARHSKRLISLGAAFMYGALLAAIVSVVIRALIVRDFGLAANGIYQAAWGLSGMFAGFILGAMGTDFYPRLTAVANDRKLVNRLVNEQIDIGVLLALPGLLATLAFAPWLISLFYSAEFSGSAVLLPWMAVGVFGQVVTYPLGFIQRAKGSSQWIFISQTHLHVLQLSLTILLLRVNGVVAAAWAFAAATYIHGLVVFAIARHLSGFAWNRSTLGLLSTAGTFFILTFFIPRILSGWSSFAAGGLITSIGTVFALRRITSCLAPEHRIINFIHRVPALKWLCAVDRTN